MAPLSSIPEEHHLLSVILYYLHHGATRNRYYVSDYHWINTDAGALFKTTQPTVSYFMFSSLLYEQLLDESNSDFELPPLDDLFGSADSDPKLKRNLLRLMRRTGFVPWHRLFLQRRRSELVAASGVSDEVKLVELVLEANYLSLNVIGTLLRRDQITRVLGDFFWFLTQSRLIGLKTGASTVYEFGAHNAPMLCAREIVTQIAIASFGAPVRRPSREALFEQTQGFGLDWLVQTQRVALDIRGRGCRARL